MGATSDDAGEDEATGNDVPMAAAGRRVRVSYVDRGFGPALVVDDEVAAGETAMGTGAAADVAEADLDGGRSESGVLRVTDAVVTLEIPRADGGRSVLSWDPAEVAVDPLVA